MSVWGIAIETFDPVVNKEPTIPIKEVSRLYLIVSEDDGRGIRDLSQPFYTGRLKYNGRDIRALSCIRGCRVIRCGKIKKIIKRYDKDV